MILAADIGGTNARLGLFERSGTRLGAIATKTYGMAVRVILNDKVGLIGAARHASR
jgi:glucokinase